MPVPTKKFNKLSSKRSPILKKRSPTRKTSPIFKIRTASPSPRKAPTTYRRKPKKSINSGTLIGAGGGALGGLLLGGSPAWAIAGGLGGGLIGHQLGKKQKSCHK
jgi:uncharacterized protein YcfJ